MGRSRTVDVIAVEVQEATDPTGVSPVSPTQAAAVASELYKLGAASWGDVARLDQPTVMQQEGPSTCSKSQEDLLSSMLSASHPLVLL
jgi:hypothetical protein